MDSTTPITGLLARAAYRPAGDNAFSKSDIQGSLFTLWTPVLVVVLLASVYLANTLRHIPKVSDHSGFGWLKNFLAEPRAPDVAKWQRTTPNKGLLRYKGMLGGSRVLVTALDGFHEVLQEKSYTFHKWDVSKRVLGPLMGDGMLLAEDDAHKLQRATLRPAFAPRHINELHPMFWRKTSQLITALSNECQITKPGSQTTVNLSVLTSRATLDILSILVFGEDMEMLKKPDTQLIQTYAKLFKPDSASSMRSTLGVILPRKILEALPLKRNAEINENNAKIREVCREYVNREKDLQKAGKKPELDIISLALQSGIFETEQLVDGLMTILVAGHETTGSPLSWAIHYLSVNPHMQDRLRAEIRQNLPSLNSEESFQNARFDGLPYLQAVCDEALRLMPVIPLLYRQASKATSILGEPIPQGTVIALSPWAVNRSKEFWGEDADVFRPDRWMEESNPVHAVKNGKYSFSPFSHGPRQCAGITFARAELAALLAGIVGSFECYPGDRESAPKFGLVTAKPTGGIEVKLRRAEGW